MDIQLGHYKGIMHAAVIIFVFAKMYVIDKKLQLLEKRFINK